MRTIAHISDLHFGREDAPVVEALAADVNAAKPHVVVASGDFTQRARPGQYAQAAAFLARLPRPQIVIPGNHDIPLFDLVQRFMKPLARYQQYITTDMSPSYRDDQIAILGINTARSWTWTWNGFWKDGRISTQQLEHVREHFQAVPSDLFRILVTHHPFIPPPARRIHGIVLGARRALRTLEACGVDMLLAGHLHTGYSGDVRGHFETVERSILCIQAGTGVSTRRRHEPNAYNLITIDDRQIDISIRCWNEGAFAECETRRYSHREGAWVLQGREA